MTGDASRFDAANGRLAVTRDALDAIAALASGTELDPERLAELRAVGIVVDDELHPRLEALGRCVASPSVRLAAESAAERPWTMDAWLDERLAVMVRRSQTSGETGHVAVVPRGMVALNLARSVDLGPRERVKVDGPLELDEGLVEAVLCSDTAWSATAIESSLREGDEILPGWAEVLAKLSAQPTRRWRMGAWWNSPEESPAARLLEVVEADAGSFLLTRRRDPNRRYPRMRMDPLTSTQIWRLLCALVPAREQIDRPLGD